MTDDRVNPVSASGPAVTDQRPYARALPKTVFVLVLIVLVLPWFVVIPILRSKHPAEQVTRTVETLLRTGGGSSQTDPVIQLPSGPWGEIEAQSFEIAIPDEFVWVEPKPDFRPQWFFTGFTRERLAEFFRAVPMTEEQQHDLLRPSHWQEATNGLRVFPKLETVLTLSTNARSRIYAQLIYTWEDQSQRFALPYSPAEFERLFVDTDVTPETQALVKRLVYPRGDLLMFGDLQVALAAIPDQEDRVNLVKALMRHSTYLLRLRVTSRSNIDDLVAYWSTGGRRKDLRPLLESLARIPGGGTVDIMHLLPNMPRRRLYTYPFVSLDPVEQNRDCHWTSVNFFLNEPDDRFTDSAYVSRHIQEAYLQVMSAELLRFGDVIVLTTQDGTAVHSAVYLAADMLFSKNGGHFSSPWSIQSMEEVLRFYNALYGPDGGVEARFFRRKVDMTSD